MTGQKTLVSGVKPTGERIHLGNYFGAIKQFVDLQETHKGFVFIANYHALTSVQDKKELEDNTLSIALDYLALGLDPKKTTLFVQSDVPEVTELAWVFNCITTVPYLSRAHAFKDAEAKNKEVNVGLFDYPLLMAADILMYSADIVPVGADQKQHIEIARDTAEKFNRLFGETFVLPKEHTQKEMGVIPGLDGQKMSKSYKNTIPFFASEAEVKKLVMSIVTDSKGASDPKDPKTCNIFALHKLVSNKEEIEELEKKYVKGEISYKESKELLGERILSYTAPFRQKREELVRDIDSVRQILKNGGDVAREVARARMQTIREKVGLI